MNNQKGEEGDPTREELWLGKKKRRSEKAKQPLLCWLFEVLPPADTGAQTHTKAHRLALPLFLSVLAAFSLSLSPPSFISSTSLHLYPWFAPGIPPVPQYLPLVCCPGFDICSRKRSTAYFGSISPATMALITATKPRLFFFNCTDSHLFVIHSHYHFPKALKHMHAEPTS